MLTGAGVDRVDLGRNSVAERFMMLDSLLLTVAPGSAVPIFF